MDELVGHYRRYTPDTLCAVMVEAGFTAPNYELYGWPLGYAFEAGRNWFASRRSPSPGESMSERSAGSGRLFQPKALAGAAVQLGVLPFVLAQRLQKNRGTGLVAAARRPSA